MMITTGSARAVEWRERGAPAWNYEPSIAQASRRLGVTRDALRAWLDGARPWAWMWRDYEFRWAEPRQVRIVAVDLEALVDVDLGTPAQAAARFGVSVRTLGRWLRGQKQPRADIRERYDLRALYPAT